MPQKMKRSSLLRELDGKKTTPKHQHHQKQKEEEKEKPCEKEARRECVASLEFPRDPTAMLMTSGTRAGAEGRDV